MAIDVRELQTRPLEPVIAEELDTYERTLAEYLDGRVDEDVFRVFRLNHGIYGQRQGGRNQMVRVKIPYGRVTPEQLEMLGYIAETYSRGWGHLTTRQNVQFHFVAARADAGDPAPARFGRPDDARGVRRHGAQRRRMPPRRRVPVREARHHAVGRGDRAAVPAPRVRAAPSPQVQDQLLRLRDRLRSGDVQRRRCRRGHARRSPTARPRPASRCSSPAVSAPTPIRRRRSKSSPPART